jgi:hypothetical protein
MPDSIAVSACCNAAQVDLGRLCRLSRHLVKSRFGRLGEPIADLRQRLYIECVTLPTVSKANQ